MIHKSILDMIYGTFLEDEENDLPLDVISILKANFKVNLLDLIFD
ncbi:MAG: hypothetical protein ACFFE4_09895 [Candidatus Thorarchaeota archaeon]